MTRLTDKQKRFVLEYLVDLNATQAAIRAGYSAKTANRMGSENLSKPDIQVALQVRQAKLQSKLEITQERVLMELAAIAFANSSDFVRVITEELPVRVLDPETAEMVYMMRKVQHVEIGDTTSLPAEKLAALAGIKQGANGIEIKLHDKPKALEMLSRYLGLFKDKIELTGEINNPFAGLTTDQLRKLAGDCGD
ncbi:MAG: terminase small subunit [Clostridiales bacterium]|nr:terminase small subunit [Clostridiales bacterium]